MIGSLIKYGGVVTKMKAMKGGNLKESDYDNLLLSKYPRDIVLYLAKLEGYKDALEGLDDSSIHRGEIEHKIEAIVYLDYMKIYRFVGENKRKFLEIFFLKYEVDLLKRFLREKYDEKKDESILLSFEAFFARHSDLKLNLLNEAGNVEELIEYLQNTEFYEVLKDGSEQQKNIFTYEMRLTIYYYTKVWKIIEKHLSGQDQKIAKALFGSKIDIQNILWIYRSSRGVYNVDKSQIYGYLIPIRYKLKKKDIAALVEANSKEEFLQAISETKYRKLFENIFKDDKDRTSIDLYIKNYEYKTVMDYARKYSLSIASIMSYMYTKETEMRNIYSIIEGVRYQQDADSIRKYLIGIGGTEKEVIQK